jgi:hypothetical protein
MIDLEMVDGLYEAGRATGVFMQFAIFDKRVLFPLPQLAEAVAREAGMPVSPDELRQMAEAGWFPLLEGAGADGSEQGAPLYVPSRIELLKKLQKDGWGADELRHVADFEEWMIDNVHTAAELEYCDDDLRTVFLYVNERVASLEAEEQYCGEGFQRGDDLEKVRRQLASLERYREQGIPEPRREAISRAAFRIRALNDVLRCWVVDMDRGKVRKGYSPFVQCGSQSWSADEGFQAGEIDWRSTVKAALAQGEGAELPIRVPGFLLIANRVVSTRTLRPGEYANLWKSQDLDSYLEAWTEIRGERRCLNCFQPLPDGADERKRFCGDRCRNAARQRRLRERNPEAVERAQKRYWTSLEELS